MRKPLAVALFTLLACACEGPDPERDGFVLVDERAAAAGIEVEIDGERYAGHLPVVVPEGAGAAIVRPSGVEPFVVGAGELIQVIGPNGDLRRADAPRDHLWVQGEAATVNAFAEMIGARATPLPGGGWAVSGPDAFVLASLMDGMTDVRAISPGPARSIESEVLDIGLLLGPRAPSPEASQGVETGETPDGPTPNAAALVGLYMHGDVGLLLDAAGGYTLFESTLAYSVAKGTYRARPGGVDFIPNDGGPRAVMELDGERLVDDLGIGFVAVGVQN